MKAIEKVIDISEREIGYCEKASNKNLDDKTANAGSANFTKYWRDIKAAFQGEPWCACFVTWVFVRAFGVDIAKKLLGHFPFVYCPTLASIGKSNNCLYSTPQPGDIVLFYRNGTYAHTGIVTSYRSGIVYTIEGNTSSGSSIVANGGMVCAKGYYLSNIKDSKFYRPPYSKYTERDIEDMTEAEAKKYISEQLAAKDEIINKMGQEIQELYSLHNKQNEDLWNIKCKIGME